MAHDHRRGPLHAQIPETIACQLEAFRKKFGRDPCPDDPIFFDPDANEPVPLNPQQYEQAMIDTMSKAGTDPAFIYAFKRTGRIVTESNKHRLTEEVEKTGDPVRIYLREMGMVSLLTREGEVDVAKRIERGQLRVLKALSRSPMIIREIIAMGEDLESGVRSIKEIVSFDEEELTEEILQNRVSGVTSRIDELARHYKRATHEALLKSGQFGITFTDRVPLMKSHTK